MRAENTARVTVPFLCQNFVGFSNTRTSLIRIFFKIQYYRGLIDCISKGSRTMHFIIIFDDDKILEQEDLDCRYPVKISNISILTERAKSLHSNF